MSRRRGVRVLKWLGTALCVLIAVAFVLSLRWRVGYARLEVLGYFGPQLSVGVASGNVIMEWLEDPLTGHAFLGDDESGLFAETVPARASSLSAWPETGGHPFSSSCSVPLWIPFLTILVPTLLLWRLDPRRLPPGHCPRCGYNLTGLTSNRCPECGIAIGATT